MDHQVVLEKEATASKPDGEVEKKSVRFKTKQTPAEEKIPDKEDYQEAPLNPEDDYPVEAEVEQPREDTSSKPMVDEEKTADNETNLQPEDRALVEPDSLEPRRLALPLPGQEFQLASPAYRRMLERLRNEVELYKLHVKHYHMSPSQFRRRTSMLNLPDEIYSKYESIWRGCKVCSTSVSPPSRAKTSGIRAIHLVMLFLLITVLLITIMSSILCS